MNHSRNVNLDEWKKILGASIHHGTYGIRRIDDYFDRGRKFMVVEEKGDGQKLNYYIYEL